MRSLYAIKEEAQVAYEARYADGFRNSYSHFWLQFGAEEVDHQSYRLVIPFALTPVSEVKHRARAVARRRNWAHVTDDARQVMLAHRTVC